MAIVKQLRRGSTDAHNSFVGAQGEYTVDTDKWTGVVHDGSTSGGYPLLTAHGNLADIDGPATARSNLGVAIGTDVLGVSNNLSDLGNANTARSNLGVAIGTDVLGVSNNLSDLGNASTARTNLGLGTAAVEDDTRYLHRTNNLSNLTNASDARTNLGLGSAAVEDDTRYLHRSNNLSDVDTPSNARTNLGLGSAAEEADTRYAHRGNNLSDLDSASAAISNLGITATAGELNTMDGITASTSELNYLDGADSGLTGVSSGEWSALKSTNGNSLLHEGTSGAFSATSADVDFNSVSVNGATIGLIEGGAWTPELHGTATGGSQGYDSQTGSYYRIGNIVSAFGEINLSSLDPDVSGSAEIYGFPYGPGNIVASLGVTGGVSEPTDIRQWILYPGQLSDSVILGTIKTDGSVSGEDIQTIITDTFRIEFSATYEIA